MKRIIQKIKARYPQAVWLDDVQYVYVLAGLVFIVGFVLLIWFFYGTLAGRLIGRQSIINPDGEKKEKKEEVSCDYRRLFDGVCVDSYRDLNPRLVAVMVENAADAWPLSGMSKASVVYEALVEGDIPRYMALFPEGTDVSKLGPVRSARPYYIRWLSEYPNAMYMHVGGSPDGLALIKASSDIFDLNEFYRGWFFWRDNTRGAPHNVYTSTRLWKKALNDYGSNEVAAVDPWLFETQDLCKNECVQTIDVKFSSPLYNVTWDFVTTTGQYKRSQGRGYDVDAEGNQVKADTVIVQYVDAKVIDAIGRKRMDTIGSGKVVVFQQGHVVEGTWKKDERKSRTHFFDENDTMIPLKGGKIWIEAVPTFSEVTWK